MQIKRLTLLFITAALVLAMIPVGAMAAKLSIVVEVNGELISFPDAKPYADKNSRVQVPVRFVSEALGAEVAWSSTNKQVTVQMGEDTVVLTLDKKAYRVNGETKQMDTVAQEQQSRIFVPLRFVSEALGAKVIWHPELYSVEILTGLAAVEKEQTDGVEEQVKEDDQIVENQDKAYADLPKYVEYPGGVKRTVEGETQKKTADGFTFYHNYKSGFFVSYESVGKEKNMTFIQSQVHYRMEGIDYNQQLVELEELLSQQFDSATVDKIMNYVKQKKNREDVLKAKEFGNKTYGVQVESSYWDSIYVSIWYK